MKLSTILSICMVLVGHAHLLAQEIDVDQRAVDAIAHPEKLRLSLWAGSLQIANPVAFCFDEQGQMYVCETFRQQKGVEDNRGHMDWLDDDLAAQTVADRLAYFKKHLGEDIRKYEAEEDRITVIADKDGDGVAESRWIYADGFRDAVTGTGAGVLAVGNDIYYTCIPDLWKMRDDDGDGVAEKKESLHHGYGVRVAFRGHDLHGLTMGPDGRLYFSIGDRGYHIETTHGVLKDPESGAVFRCELDGSKLEVFATGLRNPQELAFDDAGNLFTGDNNSDSGDKARWVHVVEGGDTGWRMAFQYLADRGPWNREKLWHPQHEGQAAYIIPPIRNFADGPSGLTYYPGTGLGKEYRGTFFLCDFRGDATMSGVRSFKLQPKGASFTMSQPERFLWNVLATDIDFGPDGGLYVTDWIEGWEGVNRGRVVRVSAENEEDPELVEKVRMLLAKDMSEDKPGQLRGRLSSVDRRVRMKAQFELARRGGVTQLAKTALDAKSRLARLHGVWGLGQVARNSATTDRKRNRAEETLLGLIADKDPQIRSAVAVTLGDLKLSRAAEALATALADPNAHVRSAAAIAVGKLGLGASPMANGPLIDLLRKNSATDPVLRHAGVMGLVGTMRPGELALLKTNDSWAVRMGAVLALRRQRAVEIAEFLHDSEPLVALEAARAIHDMPITSAMPELANLISQPTQDDALLRRVLNANYQLGGENRAMSLGRFAASNANPSSMRIEAIEMLRTWAKPSGRDRVLGMWRPIEPRSQDVAERVVLQLMTELKDAPQSVTVAAADVASKLGLKEVAGALHQMFNDAKLSGADRATILRGLAELDYTDLDTAVRDGLAATSVDVRITARDVLANRDPQRAVNELATAMMAGETVERQNALSTLSRIDAPEARQVLMGGINQLIKGDLPQEIQLDLVEAVITGPDSLRNALQPFLDQLASTPYGIRSLALHGGDAKRGETVFHEKVELSCLRCHSIGKEGGRVGPNLAGIGKAKPRQYLLESIVDPNKAIAEGFGTLVVVTADGLQLSGVVRKEMDDLIHMIDKDGNRFFVAKDEIEDRQQGKSAMPEDLVKQMSNFELRDLVAYLATLETPYVEEMGEEHE